MDKFVEFLGWCRDLEVPALTCWLLSRENLERPASELEPYFGVLADLFERLPETRGGEGLRFGVIGSLDLLPDRLREAAGGLTRRSGIGERRLTIAPRGGRQEIVDAVRHGWQARRRRSQLCGHGEAIDAGSIAVTSTTADLPDDLVIHQRLIAASPFLLWRPRAECSFVMSLARFTASALPCALPQRRRFGK
jgi:short-chain Z-isoprenyl diphosphate synthase